MLKTLLALLTTSLAAACGGGGGGDQEKEITFGPCNVTVDGPVLTISSVISSSSARSIEAVTLTEVKRDEGLLDFTNGIPNGMNMVAAGITLGCTAPCGFGFSAGVYSFRVSASGFASREVAVTAKYALAEGPGCPLHLSKGTHVVVALDPL